MSFLKAGPLQTKIIDILCNNEIVRTSNLHPVEIYVGLKNLEKGGKYVPQLILIFHFFFQFAFILKFKAERSSSDQIFGIQRGRRR